jgi:hypothetical protein
MYIHSNINNNNIYIESKINIKHVVKTYFHQKNLKSSVF